MAPEYGATIGFFPIDDETLAYLRLSGRDAEQVELVEAYAKAQGTLPHARHAGARVHRHARARPRHASSRASPARGGRRTACRCARAKAAWEASLADYLKAKAGDPAASASGRRWTGQHGELRHGAVVIAAITSCTNTSNPSVMLAAGLLARKAAARGLAREAVGEDEPRAGIEGRDALPRGRRRCSTTSSTLGFDLVGYGCTTCIGNSARCPSRSRRRSKAGDLVVAAVLSGNRNFEGRVNPLVRANYLASPPLVVAYALAGTMDFDPEHDPLGTDPQGKPVFLRDIWPTPPR